MTAETTTQNTRRTYTAGRRPASPGIGPLRLIPSILVMGLLILAIIIAMFIGFLIAIAVAAAAMIISAPGVIQTRCRPLYSAWGQAWKFKRAERKGLTTYRAGLVGVTADGRRRLPGLLAPVNVWNCERDGAGNPFALIEIPGSRQWAVSFRGSPEGGALTDAETKDIKVANWGHLLAALGETGGVRQVAAVIQTEPDTGARLRAYVEHKISPTAPEFAVNATRASAIELPQGISTTTGHVTVTFTERHLQAKGSVKARAQIAADEIGRLMPEIQSMIGASGLSSVRPVTLFDLTRRVSEAFDPATAVPNAVKVAAGEPVEIPWDDCGPTAADEHRSMYRHDSGVSRVWEALRMPAGAVFDTVMNRLIEPMPEAPHKRVTMIYYPADSSMTAEITDRDIRTAQNRVNRRKGQPHAHDTRALKAANQAAEEEAEGAGIAEVSLVITVTVLDDDDLDAASTAIERTGRGKFRPKPVYGGQAAAFVNGLGLGPVMPDLSVIPAGLRDHF